MFKPEIISSPANPILKEVRRALAQGGLTREGWCVAETAHLLEEALRSRCEVKLVIAAESAWDRLPRLTGIRAVVVPDALLQKIAGTETSPGVIALVRPPEWQWPQLVVGRALVVVLDGLQDPGNAGAILRAAEAFGATGALFLRGTASPFNSKTLRASAGSLFRVPFQFAVEPARALAGLREAGVLLYAAVPGEACPLSQADLTVACGLIIGNEAHGVSRVWRAAARDVSIPTVGVESLNAAVAAGILLYEARRQRVGCA